MGSGRNCVLGRWAPWGRTAGPALSMIFTSRNVVSESCRGCWATRCCTGRRALVPGSVGFSDGDMAAGALPPPALPPEAEVPPLPHVLEPARPALAGADDSVAGGMPLNMDVPLLAAGPATASCLVEADAGALQEVVVESGTG